MRRVPTNSFHASVGRTIGAFVSGAEGDVDSFEKAFARYAGVKHAFLVGSGTSALYVILKALGDFSERNEVVIPAYMVPTLTLAISRAGLSTRLCDIDRTTFNMDAAKLGNSIGKKTLAVVPAHLFGFPMDPAPIRKMAREGSFFVVEDAAQAPGAMLGGRRVGGGGDVGFFSLCKGKIISTFRGGVITTNDPDIGRAVRREVRSLKEPGPLFDLRLLVTLVLLAGAVRPAVYGALLPIIGRFKSTTVHARFEPSGATPFVARLGTGQMDAVDRQVAARVKNGTTLLSGLAGVPGIVTPRVISGAVPSFNHLPVVIEDKRVIERLRTSLLARGIDTARMYERPVHHIYDLGYARSPDPFPEAAFIAERLLVLPTHPLVSEDDILTMIDTIKRTM
ncbi:MAG: DegT/DnrJ/EryC1/StrS family aminotransferase [Deltaproteobacteria bacterium]|nr:DegT/DnrJ/EryC1/StrS family aminotransferase [Candidatus Zymogenaceae bacterium]